jgi:hypothetical protein
MPARAVAVTLECDGSARAHQGLKAFDRVIGMSGNDLPGHCGRHRWQKAAFLRVGGYAVRS